jgi:hypothetical protein
MSSAVTFALPNGVRAVARHLKGNWQPTPRRVVGELLAIIRCRSVGPAPFVVAPPSDSGAGLLMANQGGLIDDAASRVSRAR